MGKPPFALGAVLALALAAPLQAATVFVMSVTNDRVQLVVDNRAVRVLRVGESTPEGVKLLEIRGGAAVLEIDGRPVAMTIGQSTVAQTVLQADSHGQFRVTARINGVPLAAVIDTGATTVAMSIDHARQLGLDLRNAPRVMVQTANGPRGAYSITLASVQVGDIVLQNVAAQVSEGGLDQLPIVLIGMSFLRQVEMRRSGNGMTLSRPHLQ